MTYHDEARRDRRAGKRTLLLVATIVFAFLGVQVAIAGQGGSGAEKASHGKKHSKASKGQLRRVRAELKSLHEKVAALQAQSGAPATPTGPTTPIGAAGGDLTGAYPNPTVAAGAIDGAKVADGSLTDADFNPFNVDGAAGTPSLRTLGSDPGQALAGNAAAGGDLTGGYPNPFIANGAVRASDLATTIPRGGTFLATDGEITTEVATCNPGERLLSGGFQLALTSAASDVQVIGDAPLGAGDGWEVSIANNPGGTGDMIFEIRLRCLPT